MCACWIQTTRAQTLTQESASYCEYRNCYMSERDRIWSRSLKSFVTRIRWLLSWRGLTNITRIAIFLASGLSQQASEGLDSTIFWMGVRHNPSSIVTLYLIAVSGAAPSLAISFKAIFLPCIPTSWFGLFFIHAWRLISGIPSFFHFSWAVLICAPYCWRWFKSVIPPEISARQK